MTALNEYQRLECTGLWRATPDEQRRDVFVSIGDATLVIYDSAERALAHWSLPAIERLNPGEEPAIYGPGADAPEQVEISDPMMVEAIETVRKAIIKRRPRQGRLRLFLLAAGLATVIGLGIFWLPDALIRHTASVVPDAQRAELGNRMLASFRRVAGKPCNTVYGRQALDRLHIRLRGTQKGRIFVLASGIRTSAHLPGGLILLNRALVEDHENPDVVAGYILAEDLRMFATDPVEEMLTNAGPLAAFKLLTTGQISDQALAYHAEMLLTSPPADVPDNLLLARFAKAGVSSTPYAYAIDISGETTLGLIEADPARSVTKKPVLPDSAWVSLQGICGE